MWLGIALEQDKLVKSIKMMFSVCSSSLYPAVPGTLGQDWEQLGIFLWSLVLDGSDGSQVRWIHGRGSSF